MPDHEPIRINRKQLIDVCGVSYRMLQNWEIEGVIPKIPTGTFDGLPHIKAVIENYRKLRHTAKRDVNLEAEQLRETTERADKLALHNAEKRKELIPVKWAVGLLEAVVLEIKGKIVACIALEDKDKEDILGTIRTLNAEAIVNRLDPEGASTSITASEADGEPVGGQIPVSQSRGKQHSGEVSGEIRPLPSGTNGRGKRKRRSAGRADVGKSGRED